MRPKLRVEKPPVGHVVAPTDLSQLPEGALQSHTRRANYLRTLHQIVSYVAPLRQALESAYTAAAAGDWRSSCRQIVDRLARQIEHEAVSDDAKRAVQWVAGRATHWSALSSYSDDHPLMDLYANICGIIESLEVRSKNAHALDKEELAQVCAKWSGYGQAGLKVVHRTQFGLEAYYDPQETRPKPKKIDGLFNWRNGLIIVFSEAPDSGIEVLRHERVHALLAGACDFNAALPLESYKTIFNSLISRMNRNVGPHRGFNQFRELFSPAVVVDMAHEELLAELHNAMDSLAAKGEDGYTAALSTAGNFIDALTKHLIIQSDKVKNRAYQCAITRASGDIMRLFKKQVTCLRQALFVVDQLSPDHTHEVEALAIALLPSQWHHLNRYLDHRIGKHVTQPAHDVFRILNGLVEIGERERHILLDFNPERLDARNRERHTLLITNS